MYYRCFKVQEQLSDFAAACCADSTEEHPELAPLQGFDVDIVEQVQTIFRRRWEMLHSPLHAAAYAFDPEFLQENVAVIAEVMDGVHTMIERLSPSPEYIAKATVQFSMFRDRSSPLCKEGPINTARQCPPWQWWRLYGSIYPELQRVAIKLTAQVVSATACERAWSAFGHIHTASRNRMKVEKAADMTFVYWSLRIRDQLEEDKSQHFFEWDEILE
jgi:hypothetical protein